MEITFFPFHCGKCIGQILIEQKLGHLILTFLRICFRRLLHQRKLLIDTCRLRFGQVEVSRQLQMVSFRDSAMTLKGLLLQDPSGHQKHRL